MADAQSLLEQAGRARTQARQARRLALAMPGADQARAIRFAEEIEEKADRLEHLAAAATPAPPVITQPQQQLQQQEETEPQPPAGPSDGKAKS